VQLGYGVDDPKAVFAERQARGITFASEPKALHGRLLASFLDSENAECSISGPG
jgi:hypothetical protein